MRERRGAMGERERGGVVVRAACSKSLPELVTNTISICLPKEVRRTLQLRPGLPNPILAASSSPRLPWAHFAPHEGGLQTRHIEPVVDVRTVVAEASILRASASSVRFCCYWQHYLRFCSSLQFLLIFATFACFQPVGFSWLGLAHSCKSRMTVKLGF